MTTLSAPAGEGRAAAPVDLPAALAEYCAAHTGVTAAVEYLGKRGAQIVLTAPQAPQLVLAAESMETARQACADTGVTVDNGWERELTELARPTHDLWRSKSRRTMTR